MNTIRPYSAHLAMVPAANGAHVGQASICIGSHLQVQTLWRDFKACARHLAVGQLVGLLDGGGGGGGGQLLLVVDGHIGQLLLDVAHDLTLRTGGEGVAALGEDLHQVVRQVAPGQVQAGDGVGQRIPLVDGHCTEGAQISVMLKEAWDGGHGRGCKEQLACCNAHQERSHQVKRAA